MGRASHQKARAGFPAFLLLSPAPALQCTPRPSQSASVLRRSGRGLVLMTLRAESAFHRTGAVGLGRALRGG